MRICGNNCQWTLLKFAFFSKSILYLQNFNRIKIDAKNKNGFENHSLLTIHPSFIQAVIWSYILLVTYRALNSTYLQHVFDMLKASLLLYYRTRNHLGKQEKNKHIKKERKKWDHIIITQCNLLFNIMCITLIR